MTDAIRRLEGPLGEALAGALGTGRIAELTHLPTGITGDQLAVIPLAPGGATDVPPVAGPVLLHVSDGPVLVSGGRASTALAAAAGDTLLVPAGVPFRAINQNEVAPVQLLLVRVG